MGVEIAFIGERGMLSRCQRYTPVAIEIIMISDNDIITDSNSPIEGPEQ